MRLTDAGGAALWVPETVPAILARAAAQRPDALALVAGDVALTYADYARAVAALAARFADAGAAGGMVAILLRNSAAIAIAVQAAQRAGAEAAALNPDYTAAELAPMMEDAAAPVVVAHADLLARAAPLAMPGATVMAVGADADFVAELLAEAPHPPLPMPSPDSVAVLQFTGGTTGRPKGVELTHAAVAANVAQREAVLPTVWGDERVPCFMPMFHSFAQAMGLNLCAYAAGTLIVLPRYRPDWVVAAVRDHRATRLPAGPTVFNGLLGYDGLTREAVESLRCAWSGSAPLAAETAARWLERTGVPIYEGYGQSEAGPVLTYQGPATGAKLGGVGPALPGTEIRIVDPADFARAMPAGEAGEVAARGPQLMRGYRGRPQETAEALRDGWLLTGDIGRLDADGHLRIEDRKKDMAIVGGYNVYPREVDEALMACPGVRAAAAVGVPDAYRGEVIAAFVAGDADEAALRAWCANRLVKYKHPARFHRVEALPLTPVGKVDKAALRRMAREMADVA